MIALLCGLFIPWPSAVALTLSSIEDIRAAVDSRAVASVDDVWSRLPAAMHATPVLTFAGQSPVPSSPTLPRILLADDQARLFVAAGTVAGHPSHDQLELIAADPKTDELSLYLADFRREPVIERNPRACLGCHSVRGTVRLRAESYLHWPGWFGNTGRSTEGQDRTNTVELGALREFMAASAPPRLRWRARDEDELRHGLHLNATRLTTLASLAEARLVARVLRAGPDYARLRFALGRGHTEWSFEPSLNSRLRREYRAARPKLRRELEETARAHDRYLDDEFKRLGERHGRLIFGSAVNYLLGLEFALRRGGHSIDLFSTSGAPGALNVNGGAGGYMSCYVSHLLGDEIARDLDLPEHEGFQFAEELAMPKPRFRGRAFVSDVRLRSCQRRLTGRTNETG